jgi:type I restriction enzyme R subunit
LKDRAERILKDLQERTTTGLAAMDQIAALAKEKEEAVQAAKDSGLSTRAFGVYWTLKDNVELSKAGVSPKDFAQQVEAALNRFPNAMVNSDEQRRFRAALYKPLLGLSPDERARIVDIVVKQLLAEADQ